ncbi:hypothetical protein ACQJBY_072864 [Aegilops geniculata]
MVSSSSLQRNMPKLGTFSSVHGISSQIKCYRELSLSVQVGRTRVCSSSVICVNTLLEIDFFAFAKKRQIHGELPNIRLQIPSFLWTLPWMDGH